MIEFPNIFVDQHFSYLLSRNLYSSQHSNQFITQYITGRHSFHQLIVNCFLDVDPLKRISFIVKVLGWKSFRDRLSSVFISYVRDGRFPRQTNFPLANDLIAFDLQTSPYTTSGSSRAFLLAFYLKLSKIHLAKSGEDFVEEQLDIPPAVVSLFKKANIKVVKIDWAILLLWHFADYIGVNELDKLLDQKKRLQELQGLLTTEQKDELYTNLLIYSYAVNDQDFFQAGIF